MVELLFCGVSLVDKVAYAFDVSENSFSTCVVEEATDPSSYVIFIFAAKFPLSATLLCLK